MVKRERTTMQLATATTSMKNPIPLRSAPVTTVASFLRMIPMLKDVPDTVVRNMADNSRTVSFRRGARIFVEGQQPTAFYIVRQGLVRTVRETLTGHGVLYEILREGDTVGAAAFADRGSHMVTAIAGNRTELVAVPASVFASLCNQYPELQRSFMAEIGRRLRAANDWQLQAGLGIDGRIARLLLRMIEWDGVKVKGGVQIQKNFTCQELAEMVGCAVETGIRMLSAWRHEGWLATERNSLTVLDLNRLAEIAGLELKPEVRACVAGSGRGRNFPASLGHRACA
jgi:CRP-like cAMP-binding protein